MILNPNCVNRICVWENMPKLVKLLTHFAEQLCVSEKIAQNNEVFFLHF